MLRASTPTKLPLARWAALMGVNPMHFAGVNVLSTAARVPCSQTWSQYNWQEDDRVSREEVASAIAEAEAELEQQLGYRLLPSWETDEWAMTPRPFDPQLVEFAGRDVRSYPFTVTSQWKHVVTGGVRATSLVHAAASIAWSDDDADGYHETGTVTFSSVTPDPCETRLYFPGSDPADPTWEIRPVKVIQAAGATTVTFRRELVALQEFSEWTIQPEVRFADGQDDDDFLATVDVYRVYNDPRRQVSFLWEPVGFCGCGATGCANCAYGTQDGGFLMRNARLGILTPFPGTWNDSSASFDTAGMALGRRPDICRLYYFAGLRDRGLGCDRVDMSFRWASIVTAFAASKLDRPPCDCNPKQWERYAQDLAYVRGVDELAQYAIDKDELSNPFGTRRGALIAWRAVAKMGDRVGSTAVAVV